MSVTNKTVIDRDVYRAFFRTVLGKNRRFTLIAYAVAVVLILLGSLLSGFDAFIIALHAAVTIILLVTYVIMPEVNANKFAKAPVVNEYVFEETCFSGKATVKGIENNVSVPYSALVKVTETEDAFYFFIDKKQAYIVRKDSFIEGSTDDLRHILNYAVDPKKYVRQ